MKPINESIYQKKTKRINVQEVGNIRNNGRKVRKDKKHDIQVPLTQEQRKLIKILAWNHKTTPTSYCAEILKKGLIRNHDFPVVRYPSKEKTVHAKLEQDYYEMLFAMSVEWDYSIRKAAHRIIVEMLKFEGQDSEVRIYGKGF